MGKATISMANFHSYVNLPEGTSHKILLNPIKPPLNPKRICHCSYVHQLNAKSYHAVEITPVTRPATPHPTVAIRKRPEWAG